MRGVSFGGLSGGWTYFVSFSSKKMSSKNGMMYCDLVGGCWYRQTGTAHRTRGESFYERLPCLVPLGIYLPHLLLFRPLLLSFCVHRDVIWDSAIG